MTVNIFEGARRIAMLAAILGTAAALVSIVNDKPYLSTSYAIAQPDAPIKRAVHPCPTDGRNVFLAARTPQGSSVSVTVCILPMAFGKDSARLIPYRVDKEGMIWGARPYSREVTNYERTVEQQFTLHPDHGAELDREATRRRRRDMMSGLGWLGFGLVGSWVTVWTVGWIVRGFLGIPRGKDRPDTQPGA